MEDISESSFIIPTKEDVQAEVNLPASVDAEVNLPASADEDHGVNTENNVLIKYGIPLQHCYVCSKVNSLTSRYCDKCGTKLYLVCNSCEECNPTFAVFCQYCGVKLSKDENNEELDIS